MQMSEDQRQARLAQIKRQWEQKRQISQRLNRIGTKIGVYSGKGGVGKTTVAVNLAAYLAAEGHAVGLLDADIDCPNAANVLGATERPEIVAGEIRPVQAYDVRAVSMSFFQENEEEAIVWRGPMIHNAINQFLQLTDWGDVDFLVVDMPPGTSDAPLTIMQSLTMDGFIVVTTPQTLAVIDAKRSINMIRKLNVPLLGVVENFSGDVFGSGAGKLLADEMGLLYAGAIALRPDYRDHSRPAVLSSPDVAAEYASIWNGVRKQLRSRAQEQEQAPESEVRGAPPT